jgi:hypothetical protein
MVQLQKAGITPKSLGLALAIALLAASLASSTQCFFGYIHNYVYYSDGTFTHQVGFCSFNECKNRWTSCWGTQTAWYDDQIDYCSTCSCQQSCP